MLLLAIISYYKLFHLTLFFVYYKLFHPRLFLAILRNFNIWLLVVLLLVLLVVINGYWYLSYLWLLMFFSGYYIKGH
jgi:hypothetical protein